MTFPRGMSFTVSVNHYRCIVCVSLCFLMHTGTYVPRKASREEKCFPKVSCFVFILGVTPAQVVIRSLFS